MLQYRAVYPETLGLLKKIMTLESLQDFFLVGGTALALQLGHRISVDLDLFANKDFYTNDILEELSKDFELNVMFKKKQNSLIVNARLKNTDSYFVKIDFVKYPYPLIKEIITIDGLRLSAIEDIIAMKLSAIANRGAKKDFFDIYELLKIYSLTDMFNFFSIKYPNIAHFHILKSLIYFDDAESDFNPVSLNNTDWEEVKVVIEKKVADYT